MAIRDMFDRDIQVGDLIMITTPKMHAMQVVALEEASSLIPPGQVPVGSIRLSLVFDQPLPNPQRMPHLSLNNVAIVKKFTEFEAPDGTTKQ